MKRIFFATNSTSVLMDDSIALKIFIGILRHCSEKIQYCTEKYNTVRTKYNTVRTKYYTVRAQYYTVPKQHFSDNNTVKSIKEKYIDYTVIAINQSDYNNTMLSFN